ncbi:MAG: hypothetical protein IT431_12710 [Phycisphaerales bacterium]|nr:hypothetical protein [Phycisphaerales bacterium]
MNKRCLVLGIVLGAGQASAQVYNWAAAGDGAWGATLNWSPAGVPDIAGESAVLGLSGPYTVSVDINPTIDALTLTNTAAVVDLPGNRVMHIGAGGIANHGTILVNGNGSTFNTTLAIDADAVISGPGQIVLWRVSSDNSDAVISVAPGAVVTHANGHLIAGSGLVTGSFVNDSLILADDPARALEVSGEFNQSGNGSLRADGATLGLRGVTVSGGSLEGVNGGAVASLDSLSTLNAVLNLGELAVGTGTNLTLTTSLENLGVVRVNPESSTFNSTLVIGSDMSVLGDGEIVLRRVSPDFSDARIATDAGVTLTLTGDQTVRGSGALDGVFVNKGVITADDPARELDIFGSVTQTDGGSMGADNDGTLLLRAVTVTGGTLTTANLGDITVASTDTATLDAVDNQGDMGIRGNGTLVITAGGLTNTGTITINSLADTLNATLRFDATATLGGGGQVVLRRISADADDALLTTGAGVTGIIGPAQTVRGSGRINGDLASAGLILADDARPLQIDGAIDQAGGGLIRADGATAALGDVSVTGGAIDGLNGGIVEVLAARTATLSGVTSTGLAGIRGNGTMALGTQGLANNGVILVNSGVDTFNATLRFDADTSITGAGSIVLQTSSADVSDAAVTTGAGFTGTIGAGQTVSGRGIVNGDFVLDGAIVADQPGLELHVAGSFDQSAGGLMRGDGGILRLANASVTGGTIEGVNAGRAEVGAASISQLDAVTLAGETGVRGNGTMALITDITNNGTLTLNTIPDTFNALLRADAHATIGGSGDIVLRQTSGDPSDAELSGGANTLTLGAGQTVAGRGRISGAVVLQGVLAPDHTAGAIDVSGQLSMGPGATYEVQVSSTASFDKLVGAGSTALDGTLDVELVDGYAGLFGDQFAIISGPAVTGKFGAITGPTLPGGLVFKVRYEPNKATLIITCPPDTNADGTVNTQDFLVFLNLWTAGDPAADWNKDGTVNTLDFLAYLNNWTAGC